MKLSIHRKDFLDCITTVKTIIENNPLNPILKFAYFFADKESQTITLLGVNSYAWVKITKKAIVEEGGEFLFSPDVFYKVLPNSSEQLVKLKITDKLLIYNMGKSRGQLSIASSEKFSLPFYPDWADASTAPDDIVDCIGHVVIAASKSDSARPALEGIFIKIEEGILKFQAGDGFRLAQRKIQATIGENTIDKSAIIPAAAATAIRSLINKYQQSEMNQSEDNNELLSAYITFPHTNILNQFIIEIGDLTIGINTIDAEYPNIDINRITQDIQSKVYVQHNDLLSAMRQIEPFVSKAGFIVTLIMKQDESESNIISEEWIQQGWMQSICSLSGESSEVGVSQIELPTIQKKDTSLIQISFNMAYAMHFMRGIKSDNVAISVISSQHPIVFEPNDESMQYTYILMPTALKAMYSDMAYDDDATVSHYLRDEG